MIFFIFTNFNNFFMKFNDFSMILKQIWISMIFQEQWNPELHEVDGSVEPRTPEF